MCLELIVEISPDAPKVSPRRLSRISGLRISKIKSSGMEFLHFSATGGCSCDLLAGGASISASTWEFDNEHIAGLAKAIELLGKEAREFRFSAHWMNSEKEIENIVVGLKELLDDIQNNRIRNGFNYIVK